MTEDEHHENHILVEKWQKYRDDDDFTHLYRRCENFINYLIHRRYRQFCYKVDVESIVNETFYVAVKTFDLNKGHFIGYFQKLCTNHILTASRRKIVNKTYSMSDEFDCATKEKNDYSEELSKISNMLDAEKFNLVSLRFKDGLSINEIAERCGKKKACVSISIKRAIKELKYGYKNGKGC